MCLVPLLPKLVTEIIHNFQAVPFTKREQDRQTHRQKTKATT